MFEPLLIEIVSDVVCPWCYIGKRRLEKSLSAIDPAIPVKIIWRPFELNPGIPAEGVDRRSYLIEKFGDAEEVDRIESQLLLAAQSAGLRFNFKKMERMPNTRDAHRLIGLAERTGVQNEIVEALFQAVFVEGRFIGNREVLSQISEKAGMNRIDTLTFLNSNEGEVEISRDIRNAIVQGVRGVPYFRINGRFAFSGAQPPEVITRFLETALRNLPDLPQN